VGVDVIDELNETLATAENVDEGDRCDATTIRTRPFALSAMNKFPLESMHTPEGLFSIAEEAALPSPEYPAVPLPTIVVMIPPISTLRTRLFWLSTR
jgi:hypothetical protein